MKNPGIKKIFLLYLLYFFAFVAFINFLHTDSILEKKTDCPACQFQQSNIALAFILFLFLITFCYLRLTGFLDVFFIFFYFPFQKQTRAPPAGLS